MYAVRCCSNEVNFHNEGRRYMKFVYLLYGFSVDFIDHSIQEFYRQFHVSGIYYLID